MTRPRPTNVYATQYMACETVYLVFECVVESELGATLYFSSVTGTPALLPTEFDMDTPTHVVKFCFRYIDSETVRHLWSTLRINQFLGSIKENCFYKTLLEGSITVKTTSLQGPNC